MASTSGPEAEFHDQRRKELLKALKDALPDNVLVGPTVWACLWLSDIDSLTTMVAQIQVSPALFLVAFTNIESQIRIVPTWTQRKRAASTVSTPQHLSTPQRPSTPIQPSPSPQSTLARDGREQRVLTRSKLQRDLCHARDQKRCVLTKAGEPNEVAHIYPFSMRDEDNTANRQGMSFWDALRLFWSKEHVDVWYNAIFPTGTEVCQNLLCLAPHAHAYWERAYFALKPISISNDKKRLDLQFFWLSKNSHVSAVDILQVPSSSSASDQGPNLTMLMNNETRTLIKSGDEIFMETDDPLLWPLPDFGLLEMQWFLHRLTAMSGAAEPQDDFDDEFGDEGIATASRDRWDMYTEDEDDWDMEVEEELAAEHVYELRSLAQSLRAHPFEGMIPLRGGHGENEEGEGQDHEGPDGKGQDGEGENGKGQKRGC